MRIRQRANDYPRVHRAFGYIYVTNVLLITGPAGLLMGFYANGGITSKVAFVLLAIGWMTFTAIALVKLRMGISQVIEIF